jgi:hypothetical protein
MAAVISFIVQAPADTVREKKAKKQTMNSFKLIRLKYAQGPMFVVS